MILYDDGVLYRRGDVSCVIDFVQFQFCFVLLWLGMVKAITLAVGPSFADATSVLWSLLLLMWCSTVLDTNLCAKVACDACIM